jgi:leucyl aminopeptidase
MDFSIKAFDTKNTIASAKTGCVAVAVYENKKLSLAARAFDLGGEITAALKSGDITGKAGSTLLLRGVTGATAAKKASPRRSAQPSRHLPSWAPRTPLSHFR